MGMHISSPFNLFGRRLLLVAALFMPVSPVWAIEADTRVGERKRSKRALKQRLGRIASGVCRDVAYGLNPKNYNQLYEDIKKVEYFETPYSELATAAYGAGPATMHAGRHVLGTHEHQELLLNDVAEYLSQETITSVGPRAVRSFLLRSQRPEMQKVQNQIRQLVEDDELFDRVGQELRCFSRYQRSIYTYWDPHVGDVLKGKQHFFAAVNNLIHVHLFNILRSLPRPIGVMGDGIANFANGKIEDAKSPQLFALNAWGMVCLVPLLWPAEGFAKLIKDGLAYYTRGADFDPLKSFKDGVKEWTDTFVPWSTEELEKASRAQRKYDQAKKAHDVFVANHIDGFPTDENQRKLALVKFGFEASKNNGENITGGTLTYLGASKILGQDEAQQFIEYQQKLKAKKKALSVANNQLIGKGSLGDVWWHSDGEIPEATLALGNVGKLVHAVPNISLDKPLQYLPSFVGSALRWVLKWVPRPVGYFNDNGVYVRSAGTKGCVPQWFKNFFWQSTAFGIRLYPAVKKISDATCNGFRNYEAWTLLDEHIQRLEGSLRALHRTGNLLKGTEQFKESESCMLLSSTFRRSQQSDDLKKLIKLANRKQSKNKLNRVASGVWDPKGGRRLVQHVLMKNAAHELRPALWGIAQLDALYSVAKVMRESSKNGYPICFAEFLPDDLDHSELHIEEGYLPVGRNSIPNDVSLGGERSNKAIIAGPNGAGKSIYLKMIGCNELLAHSMGIAVAERMRTSWFDAIRTCINPSESVKDANSKFQAEKKRMDNIMAEYSYHIQLQPSYKMLTLADEPLSGTTEQIAARKINQHYIEPIRDAKQFAICMATHNKELAKFTDAAEYTSYQVCFDLSSAGLPEPTFKVLPGKPEWWFSSAEEDIRSQDMFVDYTTTLKNIEGYQTELPVAQQTRDYYKGQLAQYDSRYEVWIDEHATTVTKKQIEKRENKRRELLKACVIAQNEVHRLTSLIAQEQQKVREWRGQSSLTN